MFTHLDEEYQLAWLKELQRIAKPGAVVLLTVHGEHIARRGLSDNDCLTLQKQGFMFKRVVENGGIDGLPDFYQVAYHTRAYIERVWSKYFRIVAYIRHGPMYYQDLVVMEREPFRSEAMSSTNAKKSIYINMPINYLDAPRLGEMVNGDKLVVRGWCFYPYLDAKTRSHLGIWIDGERVDSCVADEPTDGVARDYPVFPSARFSGFSRVVNINSLKEGRHVIELTEGTNIMPIYRRFFFKGKSH